MENNLSCPPRIPLKCLSPVMNQIVNNSSKKVTGETIMKGDTMIFTWNSIVKMREIFEKCSNQIQVHKWRNIKKMKINFALTTWINTQQMKILCSALRRLSVNLTELELRFDESAEILDEGLELLGCCIGRHVSNLKKISLVFLGYKNTTSDGLNRFTFEISRNLVNLKYLELTLSCKNDSYEQDINSPQTLTDWGLKQMGALICHNAQNLVELSLELRNSIITSKGLGSLGLEIGRHLVKLKKLYLSFFKCENIEDDEFEIIGRNILKNTHYLNSLKLDFCGCEGISDLGVKALGFAIWPYSKKLESLVISLLGCINVSQQSKDNLCRLAFSIPKFELRI